MTKNQFARAERLARQARAKELQILAESRGTANQRYVQDALDWIWSLILFRKMQQRDSLPELQRQRVNTLHGLYS